MYQPDKGKCHFVKGGTYMNVKEYKYADWFMMFGDGDIYHMEAYNPYQKDTGEFMVQFFFTPTPEMVDKYELKVGEEISEKHGLVEMHYPKVYVHFLKISSEVTRGIIDLDLLGNQTEYSMESMANKERVRIYQKQGRIMNIHNHQLTKELNLTMNRQEQQLTQYKRMIDKLKDKSSKDDGILPTQQPATFGGR
jgi:hypothetical protein